MACGYCRGDLFLDSVLPDTLVRGHARTGLLSGRERVWLVVLAQPRRANDRTYPIQPYQYAHRQRPYHPRALHGPGVDHQSLAPVVAQTVFLTSHIS